MLYRFTMAMILGSGMVSLHGALQDIDWSIYPQLRDATSFTSEWVAAKNQKEKQQALLNLFDDVTFRIKNYKYEEEELRPNVHPLYGLAAEAGEFLEEVRSQFSKQSQKLLDKAWRKLHKLSELD